MCNSLKYNRFQRERPHKDSHCAPDNVLQCNVGICQQHIPVITEIYKPPGTANSLEKQTISAWRFTLDPDTLWYKSLQDQRCLNGANQNKPNYSTNTRCLSGTLDKWNQIQTHISGVWLGLKTPTCGTSFLCLGPNEETGEIDSAFAAHQTPAPAVGRV